MSELKPCPFCGEKPDIVYCGPGVYVSCCNDDCPCTCEAWGENEDRAEEAWNTRACEILEGDGTGEALPEIGTCDALDAENAKLRELVQELWHLVNHRSGYGYAAALELIEELGIEVG